MIIECNEINPYYVYRHRRLDTFEIFYVGISKVKSRCRNRSTRNKIWKDIINKTKYSVEIIQENLSNNIRIGGASWWDGVTFLGHIDGLGIWNVGLSSEQALAIYNKQASGLEIL